MKPLKMADILFHGESQAEKRPPKKRKRERKKTSQRTFRSGSDANADGTQMYTRTIMA